MTSFSHIPVLLNEVLDEFVDSQGTIIDATLGLGGHSFALLEQNKNINIIGIDKDIEAIALAKERLNIFGARFKGLHSSFSNGIKDILSKNDNIIGILADIGISSYQVDNPNRGFSFYSDSLDMRMDTNSYLTAKMVINSYSKDELHRIFIEYGEIKNPTFITKIILDYRKNHTINTAKELSQLIESHSKINSKIHPATLVFQSLRIEVNDELGELKRFLNNIENLKKAKVAIISFHSLEDRIVKEKFKTWAKSCICSNDTIKCICGNNHKKGDILYKKPIIPSQNEIRANKRSRSAKMRCFRFYE